MTNPTPPLISVILPVWNGEAFITETLASLTAQTFTNFEILAIDNGSTDSTPTLLKQAAAKDPRIKPIFNETNLGLVGSLNKGIEHATGRYVARMDGDDLARWLAISGRKAGWQNDP